MQIEHQPSLEQGKLVVPKPPEITHVWVIGSQHDRPVRSRCSTSRSGNAEVGLIDYTAGDRWAGAVRAIQAGREPGTYLDIPRG